VPVQSKIPKGRKIMRFRYLCIVILVFTVAHHLSARIIFVDVNTGSDANNGSSWQQAYATLYKGMEVSQAGDQIWVSSGVYTPTENESDREATFQLIKNVVIYGGFKGNETALNQRNWNNNPTVLTGNIVNTPTDPFKAIENANNLGDYSYSVVTGSGTDNTAILDGFIVTGGNADATSGSANDPEFAGGGVFSNDGSPTLVNLVISGNRATVGGGMSNINNSSPLLINVVISDNVATSSGGGITNNSNCTPILINITISGNHSGALGGGLINWTGPNEVTLTNVIIWGNTADGGGNEIYNGSSSTIEINHSIYRNGEGDLVGEVGFTTNNTITRSPLFYPGSADFRLQVNSPAVNAGTNSPYLSGEIANGVSTDIAGKSRIIHGTVDIGAYEWEWTGNSRIYVNAEAIGGMHGTSWEDAYPELYNAMWTIGIVGSSIINEVLVSAGTYRPTDDPEDRSASFQLKNGVSIYGGFPGNGINVNERDWMLNETILSGDINDSGDFTGNSYHVVTGNGLDETAVLEGFIITGGNADGDGLDGFGGGILTNASSPVLSNLIIHGNRATGNQGGGGFFDGGSKGPTLLNVVVKGNISEGNGGGMTLSSGSEPTLTNVTITGNRANESGGGVYITSGPSPLLNNVTVSGNNAGANGGGIYITSTGNNPTFINTILWGNRAGVEADELYVTSAEITISHCLIEGGIDGSGVEMRSTSFNNGGGNINGNPVFVQAVAPSLAPTTIGNYRLEAVSDAIAIGSNDVIKTIYDLDGNSRIVGGTIDAGAYEYQSARVSVAKEITHNNVLFEFGDTHIGMSFIGSVTGNPPLLFVDYYDNDAGDISFDGQSPDTYSDNRWVIIHTGGRFVNALLMFDNVSDITGIEDLNSISIYHRDEVGSGLFSKLDTSVEGNRIVATVSTFSEFLLGWDESTVSVDDNLSMQIPVEFALHQNYPNPFNPSTQIRFDITEEATVRLEILNVLGQRVAVLVDEHRPAGYYTERFNAGHLASGAYFYRLQAGDFISVKKLMLVR
jgi:hypothetical protein